MNALSAFFKKLISRSKSNLPAIPYGDFVTLYNRQIFNQSYDDQLRLAIMVCEKLLPEYYQFYEAYNWGSPDILLDAVKYCKSSMLTKIDTSVVQAITLKLDAVTPDMDEFGTDIGTYALNACVAIFETLQFLLDQTPVHIYNVGIAYTDTIDFKIQEEHELSEDQIDKHPLMIAARHFLINQSRTP